MFSSTTLTRSPRGTTAAKNAGSESMVVRLGSLDSMLELAGEVIIVSSNLNALGREIHEG